MAPKRSDSTAAAESTPGKKAQDSAAPMSKTEKLSPVLDAIGKRLRAARKRLGRIKSIEEIKDKELNTDQLETVRSKLGVLAIIDELEKITPLLEKAVSDEIAEAFEAKIAKDAAKDAKRAEKERIRAEAADAQQTNGTSKDEKNATDRNRDNKRAEDRVLEVLYFAHLFGNADSAPSTWAQVAECNSCLTHDLHHEGIPLTEADLLEITAFGHSLVRREPQKPISHLEALTECKALAQTYLSDDSRVGNSLQRILNSAYSVTTPQAVAAPSPEVENLAGGSESSEYRNLAVSGAEAVLEGPSSQPAAFPPQQALHAADIAHPATQFYSPVYATGATFDQSAANAAFHSVPVPDQQAGVNFMVTSTLEGGGPTYTQMPQGMPQTVPVAQPPDPQQPQQQNGAHRGEQRGHTQHSQPQGRARHQPQQQAQHQPQQSGELKINGGAVDSSDGQVVPPNATGRDNRPRRHAHRDHRDRRGGGERTQSGDMPGQQQEGGRGNGRGSNRGRGRGGPRPPREAREGGDAYQGGRGEGRGQGGHRPPRNNRPSTGMPHQAAPAVGAQ